LPIRTTRARRNEGLGQYIVPLYTRPTLRFLFGEEYEPVAELIFGPCTSRPDPALLASLKELWGELREDILAAQAQYQPNKKPWGTKFDKKDKE
jgi:hypothetical protein